MKYILLFFNFLFFLSCVYHSDIKSNDDVLVLNLDESDLEDSIYISSFVKTVVPIFLETNEESFIGIVSSVQVVDGFIYVLDKQISKSLFVFDIEGKYVRKIGKLGQGPGEYLSISDFSVSTENKEIYCVDDNAKKINIYDLLSGDFVRYIGFKDESLVYKHIQCNDDLLFVDVFYKNKSSEGPMLHAIDVKNGNIKSKYLDLETHNCGWNERIFRSESFFLCKNSNNPKYYQCFMDTMMVVREGLIAPYLVVKSKDWFTYEDVKKHKNESWNIANDVYFEINKLPIAFNIQNYTESSRIINFAYTKQSEYINVIYDKKEAVVKRCRHLLDDVMYNRSNDVPLIACNDENGVYAYIDTPVIPDFCRFMEDPGSGIKPDYLKQFINNLTPESNPVILYYEYKK